MPRVYEPLVLEIEPPYIGSAVSPTVEIMETSEDVTVTITDVRGDHSYTVDKTDQAIADANAAAANASAAASTATAKGQQAVDIATTAAGNADDAARDARAAMADTQAATQAANAATSNAQAATSTANTAAQNADAKATLANTAAANADAKATLADNAATSANAAAAQASTSAANADTSATAANTAAAAADAAREAIQDDLANKADIDGYYPLLGAGASDALMSADATVDTFAQRVSDHDGGVRVESLRGNTIRWNQLAAVTLASTTINGVTFTNNGDGSVTVNGTATAQALFNTSLRVNSVSGHKLLVKGCPAGGSTASSYRLKNGYGIGADTGNGLIETSTNVYVVAQIIIASGYTANSLKFVPQIFDLTDIFGAGNEPATIAEFERQYPESYYPYDAGSLLSVNVEGIRSAGVIREIPAATYFPDGMRSAGSAYDELTSEKAITRIGAVDLGMLTWRVGSRGAFYADISPNPRIIGVTILPNALCIGYEPATFNDIYNHYADTPDKSYSVTNGNSGNHAVYFKDLTYTTAADFKTAMNGVMLYYELATPTETAIDPPLNLAYPTEQGGTESIVIPTGEMSAAPTMAIVYAYNADGVRDISQAIIATIEGATASTNYAIGGYFVHGGVLYRATSAIAAGETITPGTNCVATTVMAEIVRLTA